MPLTSALPADMRDALRMQERADIVVGIPSFRNAATIGHVTEAAAEGLRRNFPKMRAVIVNADGGSEDGTRDRVRESADGMPIVTGRYEGRSGKGSAFRAIFEAVTLLGARACAVVDSDLRSITPEWIARLIGPIVGGETDYVTPLYARHKHDGTITNTIAYPLTRALYGARVRQPIGGEFGFGADLARVYLAEPVWESDVAKFGIDIFMTTTALARGVRVAQAFLGAKIHDPKDPGADLGPMFTQVVGTLLTLARKNVDVWRPVTGSRDVPVIGEISPVEPEAVNASVRVLVEKFRAGAGDQDQAWAEILSADTRDIARKAAETGNASAIGSRFWAKAVYEIVAAARTRDDTETLALALLPLYFGRVAALIGEMQGLDQAAAERVVEQQALAFEQTKPYLLERWA
ncbi:MAG TPA: glycosyltransferase [Candidatus Bathyarchaeia archaeon]|nr:glycosyltransferase [Candidatus Bathyarchaeia archaeon]